MVPPVVDHCSDIAALLSPCVEMATTVRGAAWYGRSALRPGATLMDAMRSTTGLLERLQPRTSVPVNTATGFMRASRRDSLNRKFMVSSRKQKRPPACSAGGQASKADQPP